MEARVALIGLGPHARRIYYPALEQLARPGRALSIELLIELESARPGVEKFLASRRLAPQRILYLPDRGQSAPDRIAPPAAAALAEARVNRVVLATEPKAHRAYLDHCIAAGLHVLTDKPITAPAGLRTSVAAAERIHRDVVELVDQLRTRPEARVLVQSQRRNHAGYRFVFETVRTLIDEHRVPITHVSIHHSDGMWNMPDEYLDRENHPYKYGYGKLLHSGYHFVDLLAQLIKLNDRLPEKRADELTIFSQASGPHDHRGVITDADYGRFFGADAGRRFERRMAGIDLTGYGELDSYSQLQLSAGGRVITTAQLALVQSGVSQRAWPTLPEDTYKGNGRIRHENVTIHLGPIASLQVHSYQSRQHTDAPAASYDTGDTNHFDVHVFRNSNLIGGAPFERVRFGQDVGEPPFGHNEQARLVTVAELVDALPSDNDLAGHLLTNRLIAEISANHARQSQGQVPIGRIGLETSW